MTSTITRFEPRLAPCGKQRGGEQFVTEDLQGLVTRGPPLRPAAARPTARSSTTAASTT